MPGIRGVWSYGRGGRTIAVVSIEQSYLGHSQAVGTIAATIPRGAAMAGKYTIVVDEDIDPSNWDEVAWAISSRVDPATQIELLHGHLNTPLDTAVSPEKRARGDYRMARVIINACKPYHWRKEFSEVITYPQELREQVKEKFAHLWR